MQQQLTDQQIAEESVLYGYLPASDISASLPAALMPCCTDAPFHV